MQLVGKRIHLDRSPVLFEAPIAADTLAQHWRVCAGDWRAEDGWLVGRNPANSAGQIFSRREFAGDVLLEFEGQTILPSTHDLDWTWHGAWNEQTNQRGPAYVGGLQGWWEGKLGIEKSPDYALWAMTPLFPFEPGRLYRIQSGSIGGHCFIFIDGRLMLEIHDAQPLTHGAIGFEAYASHIRLRHIRVRQIVWEELRLRYE